MPRTVSVTPYLQDRRALVGWLDVVADRSTLALFSSEKGVQSPPIPRGVPDWGWNTLSCTMVVEDRNRAVLGTPGLDGFSSVRSEPPGRPELMM